MLNMEVIGVNSCSETVVMQTRRYSPGINLLKHRDSSKIRMNCSSFAVLHFAVVLYVSAHHSSFCMDVLVLLISAAVIPRGTKISI